MTSPRNASCVWGILLSAALVVGCGPTPVEPPATSSPGATKSLSGLSQGSAACVAPAAGCPACAIQAVPDAADSEGYRRSRWLAPADRGTRGVLKVSVTDQEGNSLDLAELGARPVALSFIYTRCTNPNKCPRVVQQMAKLAAMLETEKLDTQVRLLVMTYDPEYDTPDRLREYGEKHGLSFTPNVRMLRPDSQGRDHFFDQLQVAVNYNSSGVNLHGVQLFLFDNEGRFVRRYQSVFWDAAEVLGDLKQLAMEESARASR